VELEPGVEGLIHVSEMSWTKKVKHPSKVLEIGQELDCQVLEVDAKAKRISLGLKQLEPDPWTIFTEKYHPGDKISGKVRSLTDYGVFIGIEDGVDGMVHKSDLSWTAKVNNPGDLFHKGDDVDAIILSINHDEKKVSLGVKQLFDDPWPTIFSELPPGKLVTTKVISVIDYGVFVRVREGIEGLIPQNELTLGEEEDGTPKQPKIGDEIQAEIANIDSQDRRITLSMRVGGAAAEGTNVSQAPKTEKRESRAPKKASASGAVEEAKAGSIGELIKQKLGGLALGREKDGKEEEKKADDTE
jgi:small subunit ribosomal protein S1